MVLQISSGKIVGSINSLYQNVLDLSTPQDALNEQFTNAAISDGSGADQANRLFHDTRTLTDAASEDLDLSGVLLDAFGTVLAFTRVIALLVRNKGAASSLLIGGAVANGFLTPFGDATDKIRLRPLGFLVLSGQDATAYAVTPGTGDLLKFEHGGEDPADLDYDVMILGSQ